MSSTPGLPGRLFALFALLALPASAQTIVYEDAFPGVSFSTPVELAVAPGQPDRVYVVQQGGFGGGSEIRTVELGSTAVTTFADLDDRVTGGGEMGLLGLAFHPDYEANGLFYVNYTADGPRRTVVSEFQRSAADPLQADLASERIVMQVNQPFSNHNAGKIAFGPDGYLYVTMGDGGSGGDPQNNGQNPSTLLGSLLRIDVDDTATGSYGVPADNPFVGQSGFRPEIYAYGLRNPWKFSFDSATGDLWLADVGQGEWEEVNIVQSGDNLGWRQVEGPECYINGCDLSAFDAPVFSYPHNNSDNGGFSVTGGIVYRGALVPGLVGKYLYADFVNPRLWVLTETATGGYASELLTTSISNIASINEGPGGEAFVLSYGGTIYRINQDPLSTDGAPAARQAALRLASANPFVTEATIAVTVPVGTEARVRVTDVRGREIVRFARTLPGAAAEQFVTLDGADLAPGVYLVHLDAGAGGAALLPVVRAR